MFLSILVPAYNVEDYIKECLDSIVLQKGIDSSFFNTEIEVIIANDGSTDKTGEICNKYSQKFKNINVYHKKNEGLILTREFLLSCAKGEYIIFLDSDDKWQGNLLKVVLELIKKYEFPDMISFGFNIWTKSEKIPNYIMKTQEQYIDLKKSKKGWELILESDDFNSLWSKVIKKSVLQKGRLPKELMEVKRGEDKLRVIKCMENSKNWVLFRECLYDYRIDNLSMTRSFNPKYFDEILLVEEYVYKMIKDCRLEEKSYFNWSNSFLSKWTDYLLALEKSDLIKYEKKIYRNEYNENNILKTALYYGKKNFDFRQSLRAWLLSFKWYGILKIYYKLKEKI